MSKYETTPQVKRAKDALYDAGLGRFDSSVRVKTRRLKGGGREYGEAQVRLKLDTDAQLAHVEAFLRVGFDAVVFVSSGPRPWVSLSTAAYGKAPRLQVVDLDATLPDPDDEGVTTAEVLAASRRRWLEGADAWARLDAVRAERGVVPVEVRTTPV